MGVKINQIFYSLPPKIQRSLGRHLRWALYPRLYIEQKRRYNYYNELSVIERKNWIFNKVKAIATYAQTNNAFYKEFYKTHGFNAVSLRVYEDLQHIPIVTKDILRSSKDKWLQPSSTGFRGNTGGTSGSPLGFAYSRLQLIKENFYIDKIWSRLSCSTRSTRLVFRGLSHLEDRDWVYHPQGDAYLINVYRPLSAIAQGVLELANTTRIEFLHGYPSAIYEFAKFCDSGEGSQLREAIRRNLKGVLLGSEYPAPLYRDVIGKVFGVPAISWYGHTEMTILAAEDVAEELVYYPFQSYGWCEASAGGGFGGSSSTHLVGTNYDNYLTPFIRYDTGDSVEAIGSNEGLLDSFRVTDGRVGEYIYDRNNHPVSLTAFIFGRHHEAFNVANFVQISQSLPGKAILYLSRTTQTDILEANELFDLGNIDIEFEVKRRSRPYQTKIGKIPLLIPAEQVSIGND